MERGFRLHRLSRLACSARDTTGTSDLSIVNERVWACSSVVTGTKEFMIFSWLFTQLHGIVLRPQKQICSLRLWILLASWTASREIDIVLAPWDRDDQRARLGKPRTASDILKGNAKRKMNFFACSYRDSHTGLSQEDKILIEFGWRALCNDGHWWASLYMLTSTLCSNAYHFNLFLCKKFSFLQAMQIPKSLDRTQVWPLSVTENTVTVIPVTTVL